MKDLIEKDSIKVSGPTIKKLVTGIPIEHSKALRIKAAEKEISVNELIRRLIKQEIES